MKYFFLEIKTFEENRFAVVFWGLDTSYPKVSEMKSDNTKHSKTEGQEGENST